jgi:hypothetical protein
MVYFKTEKPNLCIFWRALKWTLLVYFTVVWYNLCPFGIVCGHLVYFSRFSMFGPRKNMATLINSRYPDFSFGKLGG